VPLRNFFDELSRRHVVRASVGYCVAAWIAIEVTSTIAPLLDLSDEVPRGVAIAAILLFPIAVVLAWFFDFTRAGVRRTPELDADTAASLPRRRFSTQAAGLIALGAIITFLGFAAFNVRARTMRSRHIESVAVMPFADLSPRRDQEYFADGVTEELMNRLARAGIRVASRTSTFAFKGQNLDVATIARQLRVQAILEGSIRREGKQLRIKAALVDATDGTVLWSESFERTDSSIFAIQDEISGAIVSALSLKLGGQVSGGGTNNLAAQELYFKGRKAFHTGTDPQLRAALQFFDQAIALDSTFALAYAGLAKTYAVLPAFGDYPTRDALMRGSLAAARAIALDNNLGEAYAARGQIAQNLEWDLRSALTHYRTALGKTPNDASTHQWYAEALLMTGDLQNAHSEAARALEIDPLSATAQNLRAYVTLLRGEGTNAMRIYQLLLRENPDFLFGHLNHVFAALATREYGDAAQALVAALPQFGPDVGVYIAAASGEGSTAEAVSVLENIEHTHHSSVFALLYATIGEKDKALEILEATVEAANDANLPYWLMHPLFRPLANEPRFQKIIRDVGVTVR
jgi:TolB-like protein/Flp pilus assembly protein TadD